VPNSTTRTSAADMLYNTTNGRAHNNSTTCCATNLPHRNARAQHLDMSRCWDVANFCPFGGEFVVQQSVELLWARPLVVLCNMSVAGVRVVEFGTNDTFVVGSNETVLQIYWRPFQWKNFENRSTFHSLTTKIRDIYCITLRIQGGPN